MAEWCSDAQCELNMSYLSHNNGANMVFKALYWIVGLHINYKADWQGIKEKQVMLIDQTHLVNPKKLSTVKNKWSQDNKTQHINTIQLKFCKKNN